MEALSLYELNNLVHCTLTQTLNDEYWVKAEVLSVSTNGGHCYLELVEKSKTDNRLMAKAKAMIWRNTFMLLQPHFEKVTNQRLSAGMSVLLQVSITFHELYGYSLNVIDIDPTYTLGDLAQRRQEIIDQLTKDGVANMNKELPLPRLLQRIAVISSDTAAGYGDFKNQLDESMFRFTTKLFPAIMQGNRVESSIINALNAIFNEKESWDAVIIIRGGGAVSDLNGFDSYNLALNVAQFPLPIITGIGHERDNTVIDFVSNTRLKTPTAVAAFLIERMKKEYDYLIDCENNIKEAVQKAFTAQQQRVEKATYRLLVSFSHFSEHQTEHLNALQQRLERTFLQQLSAASLRIQLLEQKLPQIFRTYLQTQQQRVGYLENKLLMASPTRILKLGYSITTHNGNTLTHASQIKKGDVLTTQLLEGTIESIAK